jgi:anti-anti-sigma regulatory factor
MNIIEFKISKEIGVLTLHGELIQNRENVLKEALMVSLENSHHVLVNMERVTKIDDQCLQILDAAREKALTLNKRIAFYGLETNE